MPMGDRRNQQLLADKPRSSSSTLDGEVCISNAYRMPTEVRAGSLIDSLLWHRHYRQQGGPNTFSNRFLQLDVGGQEVQAVIGWPPFAVRTNPAGCDMAWSGGILMPLLSPRGLPLRQPAIATPSQTTYSRLKWRAVTT